MLSSPLLNLCWAGHRMDSDIAGRSSEAVLTPGWVAVRVGSRMQGRHSLGILSSYARLEVAGVASTV